MCPFSFWTMGLDNASLLEGLFLWLIISLFNASLYAVPGLPVGVAVGIISFLKSN